MMTLVADFEWDSSVGGAARTAILFVGLVVVSLIVNRVATRVFGDTDQRFNVRRIVRAIIWFVAVFGLIVIWQPLGGSLAPTLGLATAGLAFAMQEAIGAIAGWFNITFGSIFRVGDRVQMGGVQGDVIDISLLKTRLMEIGDDAETTWVGGRQYTGRVVTVSNKATFTEPVYNYSSFFEYIWEEIEVAIPHHEDWRGASLVLEEEARRQATAEGAREAMATVRQRFPVPDTEVEPRVFAAADETYMRLAVRFVVPVRSARTVKDQITRRIHRRLEAAGVEVVATQVVQQAATVWEPIEALADPEEPDTQS
ncbi:mechanosensitive ion channel family protein [Demequina sp. TTPB684]|uniref:mechanosensitive ion channel family protein n=1 Tax=unclassified Demequina TaxID=2620311 RepID=UPI001CF27218|nr:MULTISPECIES: mechanosensitive ion channel domain-containing protein [unclassified Demequina]MCB2412414.1 mechanosensitive ion channel family protein [Demequina sp. TTPB684]UPU89502.1 mechanosensitive ion channel family protein [Demequina sp. TMPB413]